jgi:hypothetical protein
MVIFKHSSLSYNVEAPVLKIYFTTHFLLKGRLLVNKSGDANHMQWDDFFTEICRDKKLSGSFNIMFTPDVVPSQFTTMTHIALTYS